MLKVIVFAVFMFATAQLFAWGSKKPNQSTVSSGAPTSCGSYKWEYDKLFEKYFSSSSSYKEMKKYNANPAFWRAVFISIAKAESCFNPYTRYVEPASLGKDAVTGVQNTSEGLYQMSYQDSKYHGCAFDWSKDRNKAATDKTKTIFNPEAQLACALTVMEKQITKHKTIYKAYYWSVLNPSNKRHKEFLAEMKKYGM